MSLPVYSKGPVKKRFGDHWSNMHKASVYLDVTQHRGQINQCSLADTACFSFNRDQTSLKSNVYSSEHKLLQKKLNYFVAGKHTP